MDKLSVGQRVEVIGGIDKGRIGKTLEKDVGCYDVEFNNGQIVPIYKDHLKPIPVTLESLMMGDTVLDEGDDEHYVLAVCGKLVALSYYGKDSLRSWFTVQDLKFFGYKVKDSTPDTIEIGGKKYAKDQVEERVESLTPVE